MSALNKFYRTSRLDSHEELPAAQNTSLTVKRGMGPRKRSIKILEGQLLNKLETGWSNSYEPNLGSFSDQMIAPVDAGKRKTLNKSMIKLKALRQIDTFRKYGNSHLSQKLYHLERTNGVQVSPGAHRSSSELVKFY